MKARFLLVASVILLSGCQAKTVYEPDLDSMLQNPLFAERYSEALVDALVNLEIYQDPLLEVEDNAKTVDTAKEKWLKVAKQSRKDQRKGSKGGFVAMRSFVTGEVLYVPNTLHFAPEFITDPGIDLHVYFTTVIDPRDVDFPDETAFDLGPLKSAYGVQSYAVPEVEDPKLYRTAVIWDNAIGRLHGFAQLNPIFDNN